MCPLVPRIGTLEFFDLSPIMKSHLPNSVAKTIAASFPDGKRRAHMQSYKLNLLSVYTYALVPPMKAAFLDTRR